MNDDFRTIKRRLENHHDADGKIIFVSSPYKGLRFFNLRYARKCCRYILSQNINVFPIAPHLLLPQFTRNEEIAEALIDILMKCIDELWVFTDRGISKGMKREIALARILHIPVYYFSLKKGDIIEIL